ncbi:MAG TPA: S1/P1 Nuclease, partial [Caulobacterales bacterium]|nr:S1/P1 Nuclease [Caulobacterales bacterium]
MSGVAAQLLPEEVPAFVRSPEAIATIAEYGREPDRSKSSGKTHDAERDPAHFIDLFDDGKAAGILALKDLPETRGEYD